MNKLNEVFENLSKKRFGDVITEEDTKDIKVTHPGVLKVPDGKDITELPLKHFQGVAKKVGYAEVVRALDNLVRWNTKQNPKLAKWAKGMVGQLGLWDREKEGIK